MYEHHQKAIENLVDRMQADPRVIALILGGSVAKGHARADSDVDAIVVVTEEYHRELEQENRLSECIAEGCDYPGGYFDLKYTTLPLLEQTAQAGSEPARNAYLCARCLFTRDGAVPAALSRIPVFQRAEKEEKLLSFYSAFSLHADYFWHYASQNAYIRVRTAADIVLFGLRLLLEENEVLFPCQKDLLRAAGALPGSEALLSCANTFLEKLDDPAKQAFEKAVRAASHYNPPADYSQILTRYIEDNELWWVQRRPLIAEW